MRSPLSRTAGLLREGLWAFELPRLALAAPELARLPRGAGEPVLVLPGLGAGDASTSVLRGFLSLLGYRVSGWDLGLNTGAIDRVLPRLRRRIEQRAADTGQRVRLVGWSLGGYLARELARERSDLVQRVITLGSPISVRALAPRARAIGVPITAIYSRADAIVHWRACIDRESPDVEHLEVAASHLGLGFSAEVFAHVAERLAR
jgi:pimeloyl-ACP methyl ester carboxylesterase